MEKRGGWLISPPLSHLSLLIVRAMPAHARDSYACFRQTSIVGQVFTFFFLHFFKGRRWREAEGKTRSRWLGQNKRNTIYAHKQRHRQEATTLVHSLVSVSFLGVTSSLPSIDSDIVFHDQAFKLKQRMQSNKERERDRAHEKLFVSEHLSSLIHQLVQ